MASTYLQRNASGTQSNQKIWTHSGWYKRSGLGSNQLFMHETTAGHTEKWEHKFNADDYFYYGWYDGTNEYAGRTNSVYRDTNGWYHVVVRMDTTQSTADDRLRIYINGEQLTNWNFKNNPAQNAQLNLAQHPMVYGRYQSASPSSYFNGLMSHIHFCDGYSYAPTEFGETDATTGIWKIKTSPNVSYGNLGHFILKDGNSVTDQSGNGNNFTVAGGTLTNTEDNPSNVFATANALIPNGNIDYSNGNTNSYHTYSGQWRSTISTLGASSGKYYAEFKSSAIGSETSIGICDVETITQTSANDFIGKFIDSVGYVNSGSIYKENSVAQGSLATYTTNDIIGVAMDLDNNTVQFYKNGSSVGSTTSLTTNKTYAFGVGGYGDARILWNFGNGYFGTTAVSSAGTNASGNGIFEYDVPTGFTALSTKGLNL